MRRLNIPGARVWLIVLGLSARLADGQTVRGTVIDRGTNTAVSGVVVQLMDSGDRPIAHGFTDARGEYRLTSPAPGSFRVRTLRIGYRPVTSQTFTLAERADISLPPLHTGSPVTLDTIRIVGRNSCEVMTDTEATFAIWEQARTALTAARIVAGAQSMSARILTYERASRPESGEVLVQHTSELGGITSRPWRSMSPDSLSRVGYVRIDESNWLHFYAPDFDVLLSDEFLAEHCFRLAPGPDRRQIGISFSPIRQRRNLPEIAGTLWLDGASSELRRLEFRYVNVSRELMEADAGGVVEFAPLRNGAWVVSRWNIRMPVIEQRLERASGIRSRARVVYRDVTAIREEGGLLALASLGDDTLYAAPAVAITGVLRDSVRKGPVPGAFVTLRGVAVQAVTDSQGRFRLADIVPGRYAVEFRTPMLEALGAIQTVPVTVTDSGVTLTVALTSAEELGKRVCGAATRGGVIAGTVYRAGGDAVAPAGTRVVGEYRENRVTGDAISNSARPAERARWVRATTDIHGRYRLCEVPVGSTLQVVAETDTVSSAPAMVTVPGDARSAVADLVLDQLGGRPAVLMGIVMSDIDGRPIPEAQVLLPDLPRMAFTDEDGAFRISNIPAGTHRVVVRRLGQRQLDMTLTFAPNQTVERKLLLSRVVTLDTVAVRARAEIPSFEEHRRVGLGKFWTRDSLAKMEGRRLAEVLSATPGLEVVRGWGNAAWVGTSRGGRGGLMGSCFDLEGGGVVDGDKRCACYAAVYLDNIPIFQRRHPEEEVPDINRIPVSAIEAIEFYSGPASIPAKYSTLNSNCGVLVIHTRRTLEPDG